MKHYIVPRHGKTYDQMIKIHDWCESNFDKTEDYLRWSVNFARDSEDYVEFSFKREEDASAFVFQWNDYCLSKDRQWELGFRSWDEL